MSNFFGQVAGSGGQGADDHGTYKSNPSSYGEWHAPPDIGTKVICIFVNGDPNYGFYIGCVPDAETLQMVPAIGSSDNILVNDGEATSYGGATRLPVTNINTNNKSKADSPTFNDTARPVHSYSASIMNQQGIIRDPIRGPISSSASREAASRVGWGVSTPGRPIYDGGYDDQTIAKNLDESKAQQLKVVARRGGHSIVMDDGDIIGRDQLVRIRTALGHQILMSDDGQTLMILHSNGQSYIELGKEGTVDIFSTNSFNVRTQGDINLHADRNINIHAMENLNIQAKNIQTNSEEKTQVRAGSDINMNSTGKLTGLAGGAIAWGAGGDASLVGGGQAYVNGSKVNLNSGAPGTSPEAVSTIPLVAQTDTLFDQDKGFIAAPGKLLTIASRAPAHAPWANAGQGVDIKTSMDASANLPDPATPATQSTNQAAQATNPAPPASATVASAPSTTPPISKSIDKNTTAAAVAQTATQAANGPLSAATKQGAAVVDTTEGKVAAVGAMAMTPSQLESGGALKPGASTLVNTLIKSGKSIEQSMPKSVFSGVVAGAENLISLVENVSAQATTMVNTMQKAQSALGAVGAITGKEAPTQITGLVTAAATVGVGPVLDAVKQTTNAATSIISGVNNIAGGASNITGAANSAINQVNNIASTGTNAINSANSLTGSLSGAASGAATSATTAISNITGQMSQAQNALKAIGQGAAAAMLAEAVGGLGGIQSALTAMGNIPSLSSLVNQAEGVATSAFNAIKKSFKPFAANVPQNLTQIAKDNAAAAATVASQTGNQLQAGLTNATSSLGSIGKALSTVGGAIGSVSSLTGAVGGVAGALGSINNSVSSITGGITTATASLSNLAGAGKALTTTINNTTAVINTVQNAVSGSALNTTIGGVDNAINSVNAIAGAGATIKNGLQKLSNAASVVQQGAQASISSTLASGLSNLPGGINTVASVTNNANNAINSIPGTGALTTAITGATTSVMNGLSTIASTTSALSNTANALASTTGAINNISGSLTGAASSLSSTFSSLTGKVGSLQGTLNGALNGATSALGGALGSIQGQLNGLTSLASAGLPVGAIAQLQSSISSLAGGVPNSIGLPAIGFNTTDRGSITKQIGAVLGDPGIPAPNLVGEIPQDTKDAIDNAVAKTKATLDDAQAKLHALNISAQSLKDNYLKERDLLGENDPTTQIYKKQWLDLINGPEYAKAAKDYLAAFDANSSASDAKLAQDLNSINNANDPNALLALSKRLGI